MIPINAECFTITRDYVILIPTLWERNLKFDMLKFLLTMFINAKKTDRKNDRIRISTNGTSRLIGHVPTSRGKKQEINYKATNKYLYFQHLLVKKGVKMYKPFYYLIYLLFLIILTVNIDVSAQTISVKTGDKVSDFSAKNQDGKVWHLSKHLGKSEIIIYFYPAAMTSGCTKQACGFRDSKKVFDSLGVQIIGISGDPVKNLIQFKEAYNLNFDLLSDNDGKIAKVFGVPISNGGTYEKVINNKPYKLSRPLTTARWTFVLDKNAKIIYINSKVNASKDSQILLDILKTE